MGWCNVGDMEKGRIFQGVFQVMQERFLYCFGDFCLGFWDVGYWGFSSRNWG